ncbi:hypothetical protein ABOM_007674 [Aspergillus bombycis]|uniref:Uncharacterized protein n=1 Tax=Aspergillus bombycis TaxID=109264 RepID=A0A1F7ZVH2_9EURO|nr:hypothetical protein ABOM_007674 [Aspergillus bombycis]OGM43417.1 hypothetical protein ABOM_007674 [Aspergillus bombycis]
MIQDRGFSDQSMLAVSEYPFDGFGIKAYRDFQRTDFDQIASQEAFLHIFPWFSVGGEGLPRGSIYQDDWLREIWEDDESEVDADETDDRDSQGAVGNLDDRLESWLNTIG